MNRWIATLGCALVPVLVAHAVAQDKTYTNAREAYLDGWFEETAQRDFQKALAAYRACVDKGDDRELAAKAMLRMAMIARALGDEEAVKAQLSELTFLYPESAAAKTGKEWWDAGNGAAPVGAEAAVTEARALLARMFASEAEATPGNVESVFRVLGAADYLAARKDAGANSEAILRRLADQGRLDVLGGIATAGDESAARHVLWVLAPDPKSVEAMQESIPQWAGAAELAAAPSYVSTLMVVLAAQHDAASLKRLESLLRAAEASFSFARVAAQLEGNPAPEAAACVDAMLDFLDHRSFRPDNPTAYMPFPPGSTAADTILGQRVAARYATIPTWRRRDLVAWFGGPNTKVAADHPLFAQMLADPEPSIRVAAIEKLIADADPAVADDGVRRLFAESPPWDVKAIMTRLNAAVVGPTIDALVSAPKGAAREWAYFALLSSRDANRVLAAGLDRGDIELVTAFFGPSEFVQNAIITQGGEPMRSVLPPSAHPIVREALLSSPESTLLERLANVAAADSRVRIRNAAVKVFVELSAERPLGATIQCFANDASPAVRKIVASATESLPLDAQRALALDESLDVGTVAIGRITNRALIEELARTAPLDRIAYVLNRAIADGDPVSIGVVMERPDVEEGYVLSAFGALIQLDPTGYVRGLRVASDGRSQLKNSAVEQFRMLAASSSVLQERHRSLQAANDAASFKAAVAALGDVATEIDAAWREQRRSRVLNVVNQPNFQVNDVLGRSLASVADRAWLVAKMREVPGSGASRASAWALATIGAKSDLIAMLDDRAASESLSWLIGPLIAVGARDELLAATFAGRVRADEAWSRFLAAHDFLGAGRLRYAPPDRHIVMIQMDAVDETLTAIVAALEREGDVETLLRAASLDADAAVVRALVRMGQQEALFARLPSFPKSIAVRIAEALASLTKAARVSDRTWPEFVADQNAQIALWRAALEKK